MTKLLTCSKLLIAVTLLAYLNPPFLSSQANITVPPTDPAYTYLTDLRAWDLVNSEISGTKPYTRLEFARLVIEVKSNLQPNAVNHSTSLFNASLDYLSNRFAKEIKILQGNRGTGKLKIRPVDFVSLSYLNYNARDRILQHRNIDAEVNPFTAYNEGRKLSEGQNFALESSHSMSFGQSASFYYQGRFRFVEPRNSSGVNQGADFETLRFYLQLTLWNINLLVGKDSFVWGTGSRGNLVLSANAKPIGTFNSLPLIKLSNRSPVRLPWIFKGLGPLRYLIFVSRLEDNRSDFAHPYFVGKRVNFKSSSNIEFGLSHTIILGGKDFPVSISFFDAFAEFIFIRSKQNLLFNIEVGEVSHEGNIANHFGGFDFRIRVPGFRFTEFYGEIYAEDIDFKVPELFTEDLGFYGGIFVPRLTPDGRFSLRLEYTHTSTIFYTGSRPQTSGHTFNRRILGSDLGPSGNEIFVEVMYRPTPRTTWSTFVNFQSRGFDKRIVGESSGLQSEKRLQIGGRLTRRLSSKLSLNIDARYQRIQSFAHLPGDDRNRYFSGITLQMIDVF